MKDNHIPWEVRLKNRITTLQNRLNNEFDWKPIGGGNPYNRCGSCGISEPESCYAGHRKGCQRAGTKREIKYYTKLLQS